jgi:hypothetical protein
MNEKLATLSTKWRSSWDDFLGRGNELETVPQGLKAEWFCWIRVARKPAWPLYTPYWQEKDPLEQATFALATRLDAKTLAPALR